MRAKVLLYRLGAETERGRALHAVLDARKILTLDVDERHLQEPVGRLVSTNAAPPEHAAVPERPPETEFMLLCAFGEHQLDRLLDDLRRADIRVACKAVLTEHNRNWTLCKLIEEVEEEHAALARRD